MVKEVKLEEIAADVSGASTVDAISIEQKFQERYQ